ncbi:cupredoxin domain-containing protein [Tumidithrix elongata RA019]|uniref:Cupredoxin domain-containing protein n=1 Tax=Tumidithrix elongata BACA0141 TaxID=2716417 RepID=A0AAW9Q233_9CYAN|nr:cupredoxin domain-containing protein [Tumidithrix elongata RA019]
MNTGEHTAMLKIKLINLTISLILLGTIASSASAEMTEEHSTRSPQFQTVEQPLALKIGLTVGGLALISAQLWWFLFSKPKSQQAETSNGIQEVSITVDGGYSPSLVTVKRGQPVRLKFVRRDPSSCLDKVLFPDFHIAQDLALNATTPVEFTPQTVGHYQYSCGMNMFHGAIDVKE